VAPEPGASDAAPAHASQSGSDTVLRRAMRRNTVAGFEALAGAARQAIPGLTITTDLIVGFPGETQADLMRR